MGKDETLTWGGRMREGEREIDERKGGREGQIISFLISVYDLVRSYLANTISS